MMAGPQNTAVQTCAPVRVGLLGAGTVGAGTFAVLARNADEIARRAGRAIQIVRVADLDLDRAEQVVAGRAEVTRDAGSIVEAPDIDVVVELIGGYGIARELVMRAIAAGKHVVTANKALLAVHGNEIFAAAHARGVMVAFEAAVAGGIPHHQGAAGGAGGEPDRMDCRHHQRHDEFHSFRDAVAGLAVC